MTKLKTAAYLACAALALLLGTSCTRQEQPGGTITVLLSTGRPETRGTAEVEDGSEIYMDAGVPDLVLLLFNSDGALVAKYPDAENSSVMGSPAPSGSDLMIRLSKTTAGTTIPQGEYTLYGLANTAGLWALTDGENDIAAGDFNAASITTRAQAEALYFSPLFTAGSPDKPHPALRTPPGNRLPLTARTTVNVSAGGNGSAQLEMKRCVAQVLVRFVNNYSRQLTLDDFSVTLKDLNPSTGYLFPHSPDIPAGTVYADLVKEEAPVTLPDNTVPANAVYELSALVFPGAAPQGTYACDISFDVTQVGESALSPARSFNFSDLPVHNNRGQDITSLSRNQLLTITVTISQGQMLSFSFEVGEWNELTESVTFD